MIASPLTPEEAELESKREELERLGEILADKELELEEIKNSVSQFQHRYFTEIGHKYVELDQLRAQIAQLKASQHPSDMRLREEAEKAWDRAKKSAKEYNGNASGSSSDKINVESKDEARQLYRKIARIIHPDVAVDDQSYQLRTRLMSELNEAYSMHDTSRMEKILLEWQQSPESVSGEGIPAELVRTIRAIAQIKRRIFEIDQEIETVKSSEIHKLKIKVEKANANGRNILEEMGRIIDSQIKAAREELTKVRGMMYV